MLHLTPSNSTDKLTLIDVQQRSLYDHGLLGYKPIFRVTSQFSGLQANFLGYKPNFYVTGQVSGQVLQLNPDPALMSQGFQGEMLKTHLQNLYLNFEIEI